MARLVKWLEFRVPPLALVMLAGASMWLVARATPGLVVYIPGRVALAVALALAGIAIALCGVLAFRWAHTTVNPTTPAASTVVVAFGIYRLSRNPMYLGFLLLLCAWAVVLSNAAAALAVPAFVAYITRFQIEPEERALQAKFGASYADYKRRVRRWL